MYVADSWTHWPWDTFAHIQYTNSNILHTETHSYLFINIPPPNVEAIVWKKVSCQSSVVSNHGGMQTALFHELK